MLINGVIILGVKDVDCYFFTKKPPIKGGYEWVKNLSIDNWWVKFP